MPILAASQSQWPISQGGVDRFVGRCVIAYFTISALESPIRYALYILHLSSFMVLRDLLVIIPLTLIGLRGLLTRTLNPAFLVFAVFIFVGAVTSYFNFGMLAPAALATKILLSTLLGIVAGAGMIIPGKRTRRFLFVLWAVTVAAVVAEKYAVSFPWVGVHDTVGGVDVEISHDWQITDAASKRVGGFARSSISAAAILSVLGLVTCFQFKQYVVRVGILAATTFGLYLTTQKGALIGVTLVSLAICTPFSIRLPLLRIVVLLAVILDIGLPLWTSGLFIKQGDAGVFSATSFAMRVVETWPKGLDWISRRELFPFGIGLGGGGISLQFLNVEQLFIDNIFLLLYTFFGVLSFLLFAWVFYAVVRSISIDPDFAAPALAALGFCLLYGTVVTIVEDPAAALYMGAGLCVLLSAPQLSRSSGRIEHKPAWLLGRGMIDEPQARQNLPRLQLPSRPA